MSKHSGCSCDKCLALCRNEPGWFIPEEIPVTANFLGLSEKEFVRTYLQEHFEGGVCALSPKMVKGACIFLEKGLCKIHSAKPYECRKVYGCEAKRRHKCIRKIILKQWA